MIVLVGLECSSTTKDKTRTSEIENKHSVLACHVIWVLLAVMGVMEQDMLDLLGY